MMEYLITALDVNMAILFLQHLTGLNNFSKHLVHVGFKFLHHSAILRRHLVLRAWGSIVVKALRY
jgi:hypothetical protein